MAKGTVKVHVTLTGIGNGILMNPMTDQTLDELIGVKSKEAKNKDLSLEQIAQAKIIKNDDGKPGIPLEYMLACLRGAGRLVKNGKAKVSTATTTTIFGFLDFGDRSFFPFSDGYSEMKVDKRKGTLNNAGKNVAVGIVRPLYKNWSVSFDVDVNTDAAKFGVSLSIVEELFKAAGSQMGLGDFRPSKNGPFGRFELTKFESVPA